MKERISEDQVAVSPASGPEARTSEPSSEEADKERIEARHGVFMLLLHSELKELCRAKMLRVNGNKSQLTSRLISSGGMLTERQARSMHSWMLEAAAIGIRVKPKAKDLSRPEAASRWIEEIRMKCQQCREEVD